jgi:hypothetical protein
MTLHGNLSLATALLSATICIAQTTAPALKSEHFDQDPHWESFHNRSASTRPVVTQDFGFSPTHFAGAEAGEMGGRVQRSTLPAYYADNIAAKSLGDKLSASGSFAVTETGHSALLFGWFNADQPGGGRPMQSLGMDIGFQKGGGHLRVRVINSGNQSCGTPITPIVKKAKKSANVQEMGDIMLRADGTRYTWKMDYDPQAAGGNGQVQFSIHSNSAKPGRFENQVFTLDLPAGFKRQGATFDRFGMMNIMKTGGAMSIYFDDLVYEGKTEDFSKDPNWIGSKNRGEAREVESAGVQNFGFSADSSAAGGQPGEIGGTFWRRKSDWAYYADKVAPLSLHDRLEAHGKVSLVVGAPDSSMHLGWFSVSDETASPARSSNFLGVTVAGPTRVGHYFAPAYVTAQATRTRVEPAPILMPGKVYDFSLIYDPTANHGAGAIHVTLGDQSTTLALKKDAQSEDARFDHFGLLTSGPGGQMVKLFVDDLKYTARR